MGHDSGVLNVDTVESSNVVRFVRYKLDAYPGTAVELRRATGGIQIIHVKDNKEEQIGWIPDTNSPAKEA